MDYLPYRHTTIQYISHCTSMNAHFVHCEIFDVNSGISLKCAIRYIIDFMVLISESYCMIYVYVWEDNP